MKKKRGIELYKGKTFREIAEEVLISCCDISQIIKKIYRRYNENKKIQKKISIQDLSLFKGKKASGGCNIFRALVDVLIFIKLF